MICQSLDLLVLQRQHLLHQEHLSLLLNQLVAVLSVLLSLDWHVEASSLGHVDLLLDFGVDGKGARFDVGFTKLAETAFSGGSVFLPDLEAFVGLALLDFAKFFLFFESEDELFGRETEWGLIAQWVS